MEELITKVIDKQELRGVSRNFAGRLVNDYLDGNPGTRKKLESSASLGQFARSREYRQMLKDVRAQLREVYGVFFLPGYRKIEGTLAELNKNPSIDNHNKILAMHKSSKERLPHYKEIYKKLFEITGKPKKILDLACGLNPFSYPYLGCEPEYLASDISPQMCSYINGYFELRGIARKAFVFDLLDFRETQFARHIESDVCFLFKALDSLETMERNFSEKLITGLPARWIAVSFPRQSLGGGKKIGSGKRSWFTRLLEKNGLEWKEFEIPNELFYIVEK